MCNSTAGEVLGVIGTAALAYVSMGSSLAVEGSALSAGAAAGADATAVGAATAADATAAGAFAATDAGVGAATAGSALAGIGTAVSTTAATGAATGIFSNAALDAAALSAGSTGLSMYGQAQAAKNNAAALTAQESQRTQEIEAQAGNADTQAAMEARAARAQSTVAAGAVGVNLGSNSFLASLQTSTMNNSLQDATTKQNEVDQIKGNVAETNSNLAARATSPTIFGALLDSSLSGAGAYMSNRTAYNTGVNTGRGYGYGE